MEARKRQVLHYVSSGKDLFGDWLNSLADISARAAILKRIDRVEEGNFGDHKYLGTGVYELRIHHGPGYRVYYGEDGMNIVLLLCGGAKHGQKKDVVMACRSWANYRRRK
ncbi:MAG TPA: type II toxin-antitoxin system RelE/ParE family toxin [Elusimicrobiales bacterium]|nr:type II toxin-antitoxin system RelE/ParE family toxin [Elusimicrobiales bacterium]